MQRHGEFLQNAPRIVQAPVNHHSGGDIDLGGVREQGK